MRSLSYRLKLILAGGVLSVTLALVVWLSINRQAGIRDELLKGPVPEATPGLVVYGTVQDLSGAGVENVTIYRQYASYPGVLIATTDANGDYQSDFYTIPGDEMVTVWAERSGLEFEPEHYFWRHYYGYQRTELNFQAHLP
jgi:hypothetical protein